MKKLVSIILALTIFLAACSSQQEKYYKEQLQESYSATITIIDNTKKIEQTVTNDNGNYSSVIKYGDGSQPLAITGEAHIEYGGTTKSIQDMVNDNLIYNNYLQLEQDIAKYLANVNDEGKYEDGNIIVSLVDNVATINDENVTYVVTLGGNDE